MARGTIRRYLHLLNRHSRDIYKGKLAGLQIIGSLQLLLCYICSYNMGRRDLPDHDVRTSPMVRSARGRVRTYRANPDHTLHSYFI